ncbi:MAG: radical SAM protein [Candidatus Aenigmatarchaeota archaeon]
MTGFLCNNNCLMCSVKPKGLIYKSRHSKILLDEIIKGKKMGYERIEFTGGEPTIRRDLVLLVKKAQKVGYKEIALSTNARTLSSMEFLKTLQKSGLNRITTTLYGDNAKNHEKITRTPLSFEQTIQGIKNSLQLGILTTVNTVVFSLTIKNLYKIGELLLSLGVKYWTLLDLIPDGYALNNYKNFAVSPSQLNKAFLKLVPLLSKFQVVNVFDFPFCLLPSSLLTLSNCNVLAAKGRTEIIKQVGYKPRRFSIKNQTYYDLHKIRLKRCLGCKYNKECGGVWIPYLNIYKAFFTKHFK